MLTYLPRSIQKKWLIIYCSLKNYGFYGLLITGTFYLKSYSAGRTSGLNVGDVRPADHDNCYLFPWKKTPKNKYFSKIQLKRTNISPKSRWCPHGRMVNALDCGIVVSELIFLSCYYIHFWTNTFEKGMNPQILLAMG